MVTVQVCHGVIQRGLIASHLPFRLLELNLKRARIDLGQQISLTDHLTFAKRYLGQLTIDARSDGYGVECGHRSQASEINGHVPDGGLRPNNRYTAGRRLPAPLVLLVLLSGATSDPWNYNVCSDGQEDKNQ